MNKVSIIRRPTRDPQEEAAEQAKALAGMEVREEVSQAEIDTFFPPLELPVFAHEYPKVRTDHVVKPKGMPPADWDLLPIGSLK